MIESETTGLERWLWRMRVAARASLPLILGPLLAQCVLEFRGPSWDDLFIWLLFVGPPLLGYGYLSVRRAKPSRLELQLGFSLGLLVLVIAAVLLALIL